MANIYLNNKFVGEIDNGEEFTRRIIEERRKNMLSQNLNVFYDQEADEVFIENSRGRLRRPLIVVKDGMPLFTEKHAQMLEKSEISWADLVKQGIIEYLDAAEEENTLVAFTQEELTPEHTHLEVSPVSMFGILGSLVPFANYSAATKVLIGSKNTRQTLGLYASNYLVRMDMDTSVLHYPQRPIVTTAMYDIIDYDRHPSGMNIVLAVMSFKGYNMDDSLIVNKSSLERGLARSSYFRPQVSEELKYAGGLSDQIGVPSKEVRGYRIEHDYRLLEEDGIISPEAVTNDGDVIIGKTSPPRFLSGTEEFSLAPNIRRESSVALSHGEEGIVDFICITENEEGNKLVQVRIRDQRIPELGDKFTSRYGQKGVVGLIVPHTDMPFTASGIVPDMVWSPHSFPTRMTVSHLIELMAGKVGSMAGRQIDGTTFESEPVTDLRKELLSLGFRENGTETLYNGITGEAFEAQIYIGSVYYQKLKHMVKNKLQARSSGPIQLLTRQPTEGRAKEGGLRLGEMEKDTLVAHGASLLLKERFDSDKELVPVCEQCGLIAVYNEFKKQSYCPVCGDESEINFIEMSYAFKLMLDEIKSLGIYPKLRLQTKY